VTLCIGLKRYMHAIAKASEKVNRKCPPKNMTLQHCQPPTPTLRLQTPHPQNFQLSLTTACDYTVHVIQQTRLHKRIRNPQLPTRRYNFLTPTWYIYPILSNSPPQHFHIWNSHPQHDDHGYSRQWSVAVWQFSVFSRGNRNTPPPKFFVSYPKIRL